MPAQTRSVTGYLLVLAATAIWSGNFIVARGLSDSIPPVTISFLRGLVAVIVLIPFGMRGLYRDIRTVRKRLGYLTVIALLASPSAHVYLVCSADFARPEPFAYRHVFAHFCCGIRSTVPSRYSHLSENRRACHSHFRSVPADYGWSY